MEDLVELIFASCVCDAYFDRASYGFCMASCRKYSPCTRKTKSEAAEFKEWVGVHVFSMCESLFWSNT